MGFAGNSVFEAWARHWLGLCSASGNLGVYFRAGAVLSLQQQTGLEGQGQEQGANFKEHLMPSQMVLWPGLKMFPEVRWKTNV